MLTLRGSQSYLPRILLFFHIQLKIDKNFHQSSPIIPVERTDQNVSLRIFRIFGLIVQNFFLCGLTEATVALSKETRLGTVCLVALILRRKVRAYDFVCVCMSV